MIRTIFCLSFTFLLAATGLLATDDIEVKLQYNNATVANFEATPIAGKAPMEVNFTNTCSGIPNYFVWDYGDGYVESLRESWREWTNPYHIYAEPGEYTVSLTAWGKGGLDELVVPSMVYVDAELDYCPLTLMASGETWPGEGWENAIDHDIYGNGAIAAALATEPWARFMFADEETKAIYKIRLLNDTVEPNSYITNLTKDYEIWTSLDGADFGSAPACAGTCVGKNGVWDELDITGCNAGEPIIAKDIMLVLASTRGPNATYRELVEFQVFGKALTSLSKPISEASRGLEIPVHFDLAQNYPNPFNPTTSIRFQLPETANIILNIYNVQGQLIRTLVEGEMSAGHHSQAWDGRNMNGEPVAGGVYIYQLQARGSAEVFSFTKKMILMK